MMSYIMYGIAIAMFLFEFQNLAARWRGRTVTPLDAGFSDYTIIVPLWGNPKYFEARECLEPIREHVMVACEVSSQIMSDYADQLEADGFGVLRLNVARPTPALMVDAAITHVTTTYALRLDADTIIDQSIEGAVAAFAASGADLASTIVYVKDPKTFCEKMQAVEYRISMLSRRYRAWLTSGACFIGRTDKLQEIYRDHSLWASGEDIETGRVAMAKRMKIVHVPYISYTVAPDTWRGLVRQRNLWWAGSFRHTVVNFDVNLIGMPIFTLYYLAGVWMTIYYHIWSAVTFTDVFVLAPVMLILGVIVTVIANLQVFSPMMLLFPIYALAQGFIMPTLGTLKYFQMAYKSHSLGRYKFGIHLPRLPMLVKRQPSSAQLPEITL